MQNKFYKLTSDTASNYNVYMQAINNENAQVRSGLFIEDLSKRYIFELPFRFQMKVRRNEDDDSRQEPRMCAYYYAKQLMRNDLVDALRTAGVDNLQVFPAIITEEGMPTLIDDYVVVNVVGLISRDKLSTDPADTQGLLMFRLVESGDVIVHESVVRELEKRHFPYLALEPLEEAR